jgi:hypothetical protein
MFSVKLNIITKIVNTQVRTALSIILNFFFLGMSNIVDTANTHISEHIAGKIINDFIVFVIIFYFSFRCIS